MSSESDLPSLIKHLRNGSEEAATELVRSYGPELQRIVRVHMTDPALRRVLDSVDICQSVFADFFVRMAMGQYDVDTPADLMQLLATMTKNRLIQHVRRHKAARRDVRRLEGIDVADLQIAHPGETPSELVDAREMIDRLESKLSMEERAVMDARRNGQSWEMIVANRDETADSVRKRYQRALDRIAGEIGLEGFGIG